MVCVLDDRAGASGLRLAQAQQADHVRRIAVIVQVRVAHITSTLRCAGGTAVSKVHAGVSYRAHQIAVRILSGAFSQQSSARPIDVGHLLVSELGHGEATQQHEPTRCELGRDLLHQGND